MTMRRNVLLGKLASERAEPGQNETLEAFNEKYGRKVIVRHVQLATLDEAQRVLELLRSGDDFQELAQKFSLSPSRRAGGLLPPIGESSKVVPKALHEVAWAMSRLGETSDIVQVGTTYHILYLERIEEPKDVRFEDVRETLEQEVRGAKRRAAGGELLRELIDKAEIRYVDPALAAKAEQTEEQETQ